MEFLLAIEYQRVEIVAEIVRRLWSRKGAVLQQQFRHLPIVHEHGDVKR